MDEILGQLEEVTIEIGGDGDKEIIELLALPEASFHEVTRSSTNKEGVVKDGTGTRPYSASVAFLHFCKAHFDALFGSHSSNPISIIELGAGIGACSLYLHHRLTKNDRSKSGQQQPDFRVLATDGEPISIEIMKRNAALKTVVHGVTEERTSTIGSTQQHAEENVLVQTLRWSRDQGDLARQLKSTSSSLHSFDFVIGTDLLYYQTDASELIATINALLIGDKAGLAFLPGLVRTPDLTEQLVEACCRYNFELSVLNVEQFISEDDLETVVGWYNLQFFVLRRSQCQLPTEWQVVLRSCGQHPLHTTDDEADLFSQASA